MAACEFSSMLERYHDGELSAEQAQRLGRHVGQCPACAAKLEQLKAIADALQSAVVPKAQPDFIRRMEALSGQLEQFSIITFARRLTAAAAAVFLLASGYALLGRQTAAPTQSAGLSPWSQSLIVDPATGGSGSSDEGSSASGEPQLSSLILQDLSGGHP